MKIEYVIGDAVAAEAGTPGEAKLIAHIVNNKGGWGSGFVVPLAKKYPLVEQSYRDWYKEKRYALAGNWERAVAFRLGNVQYVQTELFPIVWVANMCAQNGYRSRQNPMPVDLDALTMCLIDLFSMTPPTCEIHMPRIGCDRGGARWEQVLECLEKAAEATKKVWLQEHRIFVYALENDDKEACFVGARTVGEG